MDILLALGSVGMGFLIHLMLEIGDMEDRINSLEERLTKLEKDAVKITFDYDSL